MENKNNQKVWLVIIGLFLILVSIVSIIMFLLNGQTVVTRQNNDIISSESIICEGDDIPYQFLSYDSSAKKTAKITASFDGDKLGAISLIYVLYYNNAELAEKSRTINSAELNVFYGKDGLPANSFSKSVYSDGKMVKISLYADSADFNDKTGKYFLADGLGKNSKIDSFVNTYEAQNLICKKNNNVIKETNEK